MKNFDQEQSPPIHETSGEKVASLTEAKLHEATLSEEELALVVGGKTMTSKKERDYGDGYVAGEGCYYA